MTDCRCAVCGRSINDHSPECSVPASKEFLDRPVSASGDASNFRYQTPQGADSKPPDSTNQDIPKGSPCRQALSMVYGEREEHYGHPSRNFDRIARLWNAYLRSKGYEVELTRRDVGWMSILVKMARDMESEKLDNLSDTAGYAEAMFRAGEGS